MRPATLPLLLVLALLAVPLVERGFSPSPLGEDEGEGQEQEPEKRAGGVGGVASGLRRIDIAPRTPHREIVQGPTASPPVLPRVSPSDGPLELVEILPPTASAPSPSRALTRAEALASVIRSPEYQDTVPPLARLYFATFGRYPDYEGLNHYTGVREGGMTLAEIAEEFAHGREFAIRYGSLGNYEFVELLFVNVLGNPHQADVRAYWVSQLDSGEMTRGQVIVDLSESGAFRERSANRVFVSTAYTELFQRTPEPNSYAHWVGMLDQGHPRRTVIDGLLGGR
jgi:hypothetical protein